MSERNGQRPIHIVQVVHRRFSREIGADVVPAHQYTPYFYAATACLLTPPLKVLFTEHGRHQPDRLRLRRVVCNQLLRPVTAGYTAVSEFTRHSLVAFERIPRSRIRLIYNGIELDSAESSKAGPLVKKNLGLSPE